MAMAARMKAGEFQLDLMNSWANGTLHRLQAAVIWADKTYLHLHGNTAATAGWMGDEGAGCTWDIASSISHHLSSRRALRKQNRKDAEILVTNFHSKVIDEMNVEAASNCDEVRQAFPVSMLRSFGLPVVCWKYGTPTGILLSNEKGTVLQSHVLCHKPCNCAAVSDRFKDSSGHVCTTDLNIVENEQLRALMRKGTTFRDRYETQIYRQPPGQGTPQEMLALEESIDRYIDKAVRANEIPCYEFAEWRGVLVGKLRERYDAVIADQQQQQQQGQYATSTEADYSEYLKQFRRKYAIVTADKAKNTYCIMCKQWLSKQVVQETQETTTYSVSQLSEQTVVDEDLEFMLNEGLVSARASEAKDMNPKPPKHTWFHERVPTMGVVVKLHKENKLRFLAKSHDTTLTQLSTWMSKAFKMMMEVSEEIWRQLFLTVGIRTQGSWVINQTKQVRWRMSVMQRDGLKPIDGAQQTYDFATMYTSMQLKDIEEKMHQYVDLVFGYQRSSKTSRGSERVLKMKRKGRSAWAVKSDNQDDGAETKFVSAVRLKRWISYLLKRLFVKVGDKVMLQDVGLPMGTSCSPFLANLVLFMYEFEFFTGFISKMRPYHEDLPNHSMHGAHWLLRRLSFCTRYIDDLWNPLVEKSEFQKIVKKIYPGWLKLGLEHEGESVNYLDLTIWCTGDVERRNIKWHSKLYDKKLELVAKGLKLNKFPDPESKLSMRCKYGVITSQLHRYKVACSEVREFLKPAVKLCADYVTKGYAWNRIKYYFQRFTRNNVHGMRPSAITDRYCRQFGRPPPQVVQ